MAEQPPLSRIHVVGYSANDRDFPILNLVLDPRVAGYQVPKDLSACPDKRYPNHVFTGAQPISGDQRVRHVWEILPSPWVPFTRYDDDLGPIQGRRRSVKNEGQVASLTADKRTTYESREGSAIVYTELEETWSIKTDEDGNSLFPIRDRDFYDSSRGPVQERRQLFVPTGEEEGSLENVNGVITQTSYEPYNEFLSVKIVQTYKVDGPQLIGKATDNEGQLVTITTQRKAAEGYVPPSPTATRTVEASREDAESLVERIVDTPQVFGAEVYRKTREDLTPQKFKAAQEDSTVEQNVEGTASSAITLATGEFAKSEQQINKFVKRVSTTSRSTTVNPDPLIESVLTNEGQLGTRTLTLASGPQTITPSATMVDANVEVLGDGRTVKTETVVPNVFSGKTVQKSRIDLTPEKFKAAQEDETTEESVTGTVNPSISLGTGEFRKSEQQVTEFVKRVSTTLRDITASKDLTETVITPQGQIATRTLRLSTDQSIQPDALLIDGSIEALGDGRTVKTETRVDEVFDNKAITLSKEEVVPLKFRGSAVTKTIQEIIPLDALDENVELQSNQIELNQQRLTDFTVRKTTVERPQTTSSLSNSRLEEQFGISIPYTESISSLADLQENQNSEDEPTASYNTEREGIGGGKYIVRTYSTSSIASVLGSFKVVLPTKINVDLPRVLKSVEVKYVTERKLGSSTFSSDGLQGVFDSLGQRDSGTVSSSLTIVPNFLISISESWGKNLDAEVHIFFLEKSNITKSSILSKCGVTQSWPKFAPQSFSAIAYGLSETKTITASISRAVSFTSSGQTGYAPTEGSDTEFSQSIRAVPLEIPPCLTDKIDLTIENTLSAEKDENGQDQKIELSYDAISTSNGETFPEVKISIPISHSIELRDQKITIPKTEPVTDIPKNGKYLIDSSIEPYKFGWFIVRATVLDASSIGGNPSSTDQEEIILDV